MPACWLSSVDANHVNVPCQYIAIAAELRHAWWPCGVCCLQEQQPAAWFADTLVFYNKEGSAAGDYQACFVAGLSADAAGSIEVGTAFCLCVKEWKPGYAAAVCTATIKNTETGCSSRQMTMQAQLIVMLSGQCIPDTVPGLCMLCHLQVLRRLCLLQWQCMCCDCSR